MIRRPIVAGKFYSADNVDLEREIESCFMHEFGPKVIRQVNEKIKGVVVPHAGYEYSGPIASWVYSRIPARKEAIIIGPNHSGYGAPVAISSSDFETPLGILKSSEELVELIKGGEVIRDETAHMAEHSIEVQLPFIQFVYNRILKTQSPKIVAIAMIDQSLRTARLLGERISRAIEERDVLIIASSDFSHYVPKKEAYHKDKLAIDAILELDPEKLYRTVLENDISMCGYGPICAMLYALKDRAEKADLLKYATSGDISPMSQVVGYGAIEVE